ncbi:MAG: hypothetical protein U1E73_05970 [Planctomycetota bacterium]
MRPMHVPVTTYDDIRDLQRVDTALAVVAVLARVLGYAIVWAIGQHYEFGQAFLTGVLAGDFLGQAVRTVLDRDLGLLAQAGHLGVLGILALCVRSSLGWPEDPAMRAIVCLSLFGALVGHLSSTALREFDRR